MNGVLTDADRQYDKLKQDSPEIYKYCALAPLFLFVFYAGYDSHYQTRNVQNKTRKNEYDCRK